MQGVFISAHATSLPNFVPMGEIDMAATPTCPSAHPSFHLSFHLHMNNNYKHDVVGKMLDPNSLISPTTTPFMEFSVTHTICERPKLDASSFQSVTFAN